MDSVLFFPLPRFLSHLRHVDGSDGERLEAEDGPVLVPLPPLEHNVQLVSLPLQKVRVLKKKKKRNCRSYGLESRDFFLIIKKLAAASLVCVKVPPNPQPPPQPQENFGNHNFLAGGHCCCWCSLATSENWVGRYLNLASRE